MEDYNERNSGISHSDDGALKNEAGEEPAVKNRPGYGEPGYRDNIDYGQTGTSRTDRDAGYRSRFDRFRFMNQEPEKTENTPPTRSPGGGDGSGAPFGFQPKNSMPDSEKLKMILFAAGIAICAILLLSVIIRGFRQIGSSTNPEEGQAVSGTVSEAVITMSEAESAEAEEAGDTDSDADEETPESSRSLPDGENTPASDVGLSVVDVARIVMPSMVSITNVSVQEYRNFSGETIQRDNVSAGSGIIVGKSADQLLIATNQHVIANSSDITVEFIDDTAASAVVKGTDADNDLAIVSVSLADLSEETRDSISIIAIGDSDLLEVGEPVVAIGNALGYGQSVSTGIISALNRVVKSSDGTSRVLIQTDASINPGNSGGALINMKGELIGINEIKYVDTEVEGVGYAIPMSTAEPILAKLREKQERQEVPEDQAAYLGITCMTVPDTYRVMGYPGGVFVSEVVKDGPAEKGGMKMNDIITSVDGKAVSRQEDLLSELRYFASGESLDISVSRLLEDNTSFEKVQLTVVLGSKKEAIDSGIMSEDGQPGPAAEGAVITPDESEAEPETEPETEEELKEDDAAAPVQPDETAPAENESSNSTDVKPAGEESGKNDSAYDYGGLFGSSTEEYDFSDFFKNR